MKTIIEVDVAPNEKIIKLNLARTEHDGFQVEYTTYNFRIIEPAQAVPDYVLDALDNLVYDNYERSSCGARNRAADAELIRAAILNARTTSDTAPSGPEFGVLGATYVGLVADDEC